MAPKEKSALKRGRLSVDADSQDLKKPRRSQRISSQQQAVETPVNHEYLPTPMTHAHSTDIRNGVTVTPPESPSRTRKQSPPPEISQVLSSPPGDTQALSQFVYPPRAFADEVEDESEEGVWGYLIPLDDKVDETFVLKTRNSCENRADSAKDKSKACKPGNGQAPGGYLFGRHPECDLVIDSPTISNRHFLLFEEKKKGDVVALVEDLSSNGTFVNDALVGRNKNRELEDGDEISILNEARFVFRYARTREISGFRQQYRLHRQLGKGHFAAVYLCVEGSTGKQYAAKVFERRPGDSQKSQGDTALQQEIALLKGINHPNLLCLKDTFDEPDAAYLVMELAPEGELFNLIVSKQKLSESETRHVFRQLLEGLKYLHERGVVHRDIKPENILLADKKMTVKLGDFGLAKIIGEDSFTTSLCGTPSYVAPEILQDTRRRRYTKAVDVWSLGVVLYICLCGFPPFSDELHTRAYPYTLAQQIKMGKFDYPSPYWDSVGDPALDLIDRMLTVDVERRITVEECLEHPWMTQKYPSVTDSTDGLTGALGKLDFSKRKMERERTLLSSVNDGQFSEHVEGGGEPVKFVHKNDAGKRVHNRPAKANKEQSPGENSGSRDFVNLGQHGDAPLYDEKRPTRTK
ncbi:serine/threonine-protein kinase chk2 (cds1) [Penicillium malachiteum]|uniref:serine/threonine-protein kinase chk2 (cds1) n=1 Tax=Penicillium malachiteum TaxID=1324776 RepID=UPI0025475589|nr:serine/threonine-protein kinase chk2 (cds1) [Penicillium malachiteum]KAJ5730137.1 serine/threonine-protein kinase chk2 (cds1) [Penicillium malachiteum]